MAEDYDYIAYIDEAGDPGLRKVKPFHPQGSSEWLILSAVLIRGRSENSLLGWANELASSCCGPQAKEFHFRKLSDGNQTKAAKILASKPVRIFSVCSNKKNMQNWQNPFAAKKTLTESGIKPTYRWFYYWLSRILLEKVTDYVQRRSMKETGCSQKLKILFSERGGIRYDELGGYYDLLFEHDQAETQFVSYDKITWEVMDKTLLDAKPFNSHPGLILPDIAASAFFAACDKHDRNRAPNPVPAFHLDPRMARRTDNLDRLPAGYGVKLIPNLAQADLDDDQYRVFKHYGYKKKNSVGRFS